ncbi:MAG: 50S ribosomal protein L3 [Dehalococcoidia bacterium]|nr:MAG: 50S ribosomal protein L3 [Dehalococcoidia bacterium]UCG82263.1 MAG: 50S ribosomal protein L3 [Dehalococcoidia bacterium]
MITGLIGRKIGMTQVFTEGGTMEPMTAIEAGPCIVTQIKTPDGEGYSAVQLGFTEAKSLNSPERGHLGKLGLFKHLREFRVADTADIELGHRIDVSLFQPGDSVDVSGTSKGRGFAGGVKRHHFRGGPKTHGQSDRHRAPGSVGAGTDPGRVLKGQKMAGHMGNERVTVKRLKVISADVDRNLLLVRGAVPGAKNGLLEIRKSPAHG